MAGSVLVTGAAGKTGRAVVGALHRAGFDVRALVRREEQQRAVARLGASETRVVDLLDADGVRRAVRGARFVYHICPNTHPDETAIGRGVVAAARDRGIERLVFHSVLHPQAEAMPHHWAKLRVEEHLFESGVAFTILQPAPYMQNVLGQWEGVAAGGVYTVPYAASTRVAMVDLEDVAAAAAAVLGDSRHTGATYELCAEELLDQTEIAGALGRRLGRGVRLEVEPRERWAERSGLEPGSYRLETLLAMFRYYERFGMAGGSAPLAGLLGRPPTRFADLLARTPLP